MDFDTGAKRSCAHVLAQGGIRSHSPTHQKRFDAILAAGRQTLFHENINDALLKRVGDLGNVELFALAVALNMIKNRGLNAAETKIVRARQNSTGKTDVLVLSLFGQTVNDRTAGISQVQNTRHFVK